MAELPEREQAGSSFDMFIHSDFEDGGAPALSHTHTHTQGAGVF